MSWMGVISVTEPKGNQKKLMEEFEGIHVVDAGPGTGKTTTVVGRYVSMLKKGIPAKSILMLTFTDNAAMEMKKRIKATKKKVKKIKSIEVKKLNKEKN